MLGKVLKHKNALRARRKARVRGSIFGIKEKPRLSIFRSNRYFYAQAIDDNKATTLASIDGKKMGLKANKEDAKKIASAFAEILKAKGIQEVIFDRNGYLYHGVVASFADSLRENGITL
ncbi:50S ribosomal protein L18 [Helicobacter monodelphidis]|uniref:50S ribosomal protein L18 n=1 Tax=Helicobacter sp. 15-1451 TaxID=2004995 RepID=UPI000DCC379F|nr:50S ribosomal protein L18 [Helicobacter sp. 15-1451]RAX57119.1 50S ribosomal protein L18 [Helicobacter sp. 15-1451]